MKNKIIFIVILLFLANTSVNAQFPNSISDLRNIDYCNCNANMSCNQVCWQGPSNYLNLVKFASRVDNIDLSNTNSIKYYTGTEESSKYPNEDYLVELVMLCTDYHAPSPVARSNGRCTRITSPNARGYWDNAVKAGVGTLIKKMIDGVSGQQAKNHENQPKYFAYYDTDKSGYGYGGPENYYKASNTATKFQLDKGVKGVSGISGNNWDSDWIEEANDEYDNVNNMSVSISSVQLNSDDNAFYVKVNATINGGSSSSVTNFYNESGTPISATLQSSGTYSGYYKILKSSLNEGNNSIKVKITSYYTTYIAENYDCGLCLEGKDGCNAGGILQTFTPSYIEPATFDTSSEYTFTLTKNSTGKIKIKKVNTNGVAILHKKVSFNIYSNSNCTAGTEVDSIIAADTGGDGIIEKTLFPGQYWIQETIAPDGYQLSTECKSIGIVTAGQNMDNKDAIEYENIPNCVTAFNLDSSIKNRLYLYTKFTQSKNLLNFDELNADKACQSYQPNYNAQESCLYADKVNSVTKNKFTNTNLSDYNDSIVKDDKISYCLTDFELKSRENIKNSIKAGRIVYGTQHESSPIVATITKTCYIHEDDISNYGIQSQVDRAYVWTLDLNTGSYYYIDETDYKTVDINEELPGKYIFEYVDNVSNEFFTIRKSSINLNSIYDEKNYNIRNIDDGKTYNLPKSAFKNIDGFYSKDEYTLFYNSHNSQRRYYFIDNVTLAENYVLKDGIYVHKDYINNQNTNNVILEELFNSKNLYSNNIGEIYLNNQVLNSTTNIQNIKPNISTPIKKGEFYEVTASIDVSYNLKPIYVYKLNGKECSNITDNGCTKIGYGVLSKFVDGKNSSNQGSFNFKITPGANSIFSYNNSMLKFKEEGNICTYTVEPEIIKYNDDNGKIDLEFRVIDTNNPFDRNTKSNWCYTNGGTKNCTSSNKQVEDVILNATNSYGLKNGTPQSVKYKITLTPDVVKEIRKDNKKIKYDEYYELCNQGTSCKSKSKFIHDLYEEGVIQ